MMRRIEIRVADWHKFWARVDTDGECWIWTGFKDQKGYGRFSVKNANPGRLYVSESSHRIAWIFANCRNSVPNGGSAGGEAAGPSVLTWSQVREIRAI